MGVIINNNNTGYKSFTSILDFNGTITPTISVLKNEIDVIGIYSTTYAGQIAVQLGTPIDSDTLNHKLFVYSILGYDYTINQNFFIVYNANLSDINSLIFDITDKNGNSFDPLTAYKIAFEIRIYDNYTTL